MRFLFALLLIVFACLQVESLAQEEEPSVPQLEDFLGDLDFWGAELSPSGQFLSAIRRQDDEQFLIIADFSSEGTSVEGIPLGGADINWVEWINDERLLASIRVYIDYRNGKIIQRGDWDTLGSAVKSSRWRLHGFWQ